MSAERKHSILAPSSKEWFHCGYATRYLAVKPDETNEASEFGTECHLLAEMYIKKSLKLEDYESADDMSIDEIKKGFKHYSDEMERLANGYANYVISTVNYEEKRTGEKPVVLIEHLLEMDYAPDTHGTLDCGIIASDTLTIIDNKTGFIKVTAYDDALGELNSQLAIYGNQLLKTYKAFYPIRYVRFVIYQERIHNVSEYTCTVEELEKWERESLIPAVMNALSDDPMARSGSWCKYCPGRNCCKKRATDVMETVRKIKSPELMTDEEIEAVLPKLDGVMDYCEDIKSYCLKKAVENGKKWKGYKLVESSTKRKITDEAAVAKILEENGYDPYSPRKLMTITELQKLVGKKQFTDLIGAYVAKPKGQAVLAPETDAREEIIVTKETKQSC
jgi:hypothetical protein|nr:MAG TPA: Protein of unknown function (DUF2800) [Caudoviricetes sp.]